MWLLSVNERNVESAITSLLAEAKHVGVLMEEVHDLWDYSKRHTDKFWMLKADLRFHLSYTIMIWRHMVISCDVYFLSDSFDIKINNLDDVDLQNLRWDN